MRCLLPLILIIIACNLLIFLYTTYTFVEDARETSVFQRTLNRYIKHCSSHRFLQDNKTVLIYHPLMAGGMNNRLISIITTLTIALVQWKVYYMTQWTKFYDVFDFPIPNILMKFQRTSNDNAYIIYGETSFWKIETVLKSPHQVIVVETQFCLAEYIVKYLKNNNRFVELGLVERIGGFRFMGNQISHLFYNKMFRLKPQHQNQMNQMKERLKGKYVIGIHMRSGYGDFGDSERFLVPGQEYTFIKTAKKLSKNHTNVIWYFASDSSYLDTIVSEQANPYEVVIYDTGETIHTRGGRNVDGEVKAMTEMNLLGMSDTLILTSRSTFSLGSYFISKLSLLEHFVNVKWIKKTHTQRVNFNEMKKRSEYLMNIHVNYINNCIKFNKTMCKDTDFNEYETGINPNPLLPIYANSQNYTNLIIFEPVIIDNVKIVFVILTETYDYVFRSTYRKTYANLKMIDNKIVIHMFVVGLPFLDEKLDAYPIEFLNSELKENNDIMVWNITHVGETRTSRLRLLYEYLINHYKDLEHVIQVHPNILFSPTNFVSFLNSDCDVTGDRGFLGVEYVGGALQILSKKYMQLIVQHLPYNIEQDTTFDLYFIRSINSYGIKLCFFKKGIEYFRYNGKFKDLLEANITVVESVPPATYLLYYNKTHF